MLVRIHRARCLSQQPIILLQPRSALSRQFNSTLPKADEGIDDDQSRISWKARSQEEKVGEQVLKGAGTYDYIKRSTVGCKIPIQAGSRRPVRGANLHEGPSSSSTEAKPSPSPYKSTGQRKTVPRRLQIPATAQDDVAGRWAARGKNSNTKSASQPFGATKALPRWRKKLFLATQTRPQKGTEAEEQHKRVQAAFKVVRVACKTPHHAKKRLHLAEDIKKDLPELRKDFPWIFEWHTREINFTHEYLDAESTKENSSAKNQEAEQDSVVTEEQVSESEEDAQTSSPRLADPTDLKDSSRRYRKDDARSTPPHLAGDQAKNTTTVVSSGTLSAAKISIKEVKPQREMIVNTLRSELRRVPFNPGVHWLEDPRTGVWNFDQAGLAVIPTPEEFAYQRTPPYKSPSKDSELQQMAASRQAKYIGSTSTLSKALSQIYFALSGGRGVDLSSFSQAFASEKSEFTAGAKLPAVLKIGKNDQGVITIDSDSSWDSENILSKYGVILEKQLTTETEDFKRFLQTAPESAVSEEERNIPEAYRYQMSGKLLMRSQLDCFDARLPGTGVFDIKTRACFPIRHDRANYKANSVYDIWQEKGYTQSYEREMYDLVRSAMLKYSMQVRIGMMDGIFVAYHNTIRLFGFQYIPLSEMDERVFGSSELADQAFKLAVTLLEKLLDEITNTFPDQKVQVVLKQMSEMKQSVTAFVQPLEGNGVEKPTVEIEMELKNQIDGMPHTGAVKFSVDEETRKRQNWSTEYTISRSDMEVLSQVEARARRSKALVQLTAMTKLPLPDGMAMNDVVVNEDGLEMKFKRPDRRIMEMRQDAKMSGEAYERRKASWIKNTGLAWDLPTPEVLAEIARLRAAE